MNGLLLANFHVVFYQKPAFCIIMWFGKKNSATKVLQALHHARCKEGVKVSCGLFWVPAGLVTVLTFGGHHPLETIR